MTALRFFCPHVGYTVSRESVSMCGKFDVYIGNFGSNNAAEEKDKSAV